MATQVFAGRTSKKTFEHTGKMNRMDPDIYCDLGNGDIRLVAGEYHFDGTGQPARRTFRLLRLVG